MGAKEKFINSHEAAKVLGINRSFLYNLCAQKRIPYYKQDSGFNKRQNFYKKSELLKWKKPAPIKVEDV